jgi:hypothetical protein
VNKQPAYAVLRFDEYLEDVARDHTRMVTVVKVLLSLDAAEAESARLNTLNGDKGCRYIWQTTRLYTSE